MRDGLGRYIKGDMEHSRRTSEILTGKIGEQARCWKGDAASYAAKHCWILNHFGTAISNKRIKDNGRNKFAGDEEYSFDRYRHLCLSAKTDTFKKIGNIFDNPELVNPALKEGVNIDMNILDPKEGQAEQQAENAQESASLDQAMEATQENAEEGGTEG